MEFVIKKGKRVLALCLALCLTVGLLPSGAALAAGEQTLEAHAGCAAGQEVTSFSALRTAISGGGTSVDLILKAGGNWSATATLTIPAGKTVHLRAADGETVTLKRANSFTSGALFDVKAGGRLILGDGSMTYTGDTLEKAAQAGSYTVHAGSTKGTLVLDGGAVWGNPTPWEPGTNFGDATGKTAILYDENGAQQKYTNSGIVASAALITSLGTVDIWEGAALRNNVTTGMFGAAIQSNKNSTLNLFGGEVSLCAVASSDNDTGRGAVFVGDFNTSHWNDKLTPTDTHFYMYGGKITRNAASGSGNQDGGGVSVETGYMDLYGGEVSYNHAGVWYDTNSGDGGGIMVRNYGQFHMWGGSVTQNFAGGYGGGIVAWNAEVHVHGGEITRNKASYGGGLAIASSNNQQGNAADKITARATMNGGLIAYNEAIQTACDASKKSSTGVGGGICVGTGTRNMGSSLVLSGGEIRQNTAANGGGLGVYAGGGEAEGHVRNTAVTMSGNFQLTNNFADRNGNGMYITNLTTSNRHYLVTMSGGARVDTNNPVYFENLCKNQVPVRVSGVLTTEGTAAIFELSDSFWNNAAGDYANAKSGLKLADFKEDIQENKIALESTGWYLTMTADGALALQNLTEEPQYTIRNGTPIKVNGAVYYRVYASLSDAFDEAASGDILYIYYNTTIGESAVLEGKKVTLMAESTSSAGRDAGRSGTGREKSCWLEPTEYGYDVMRGNFLKYVGGSDGDYTISGGTASRRSGPYKLETAEGGATAYNIRNDYTITLSSRLYLGESTKGNDAGEGAVIVKAGATLEVGQAALAGMGAGSLTFDGNLSSPKEGPMFQASGELALHSGITVKNHSNYSLAHPGTVEVKRGGSLVMEEGVTFSGNVSPVAGVVYVAEGGGFTMNGGAITGNLGAMPRYGFMNSSGARLASYDTAYWGQAKYYAGAGAIYNRGSFTMKGGTLSENRGEYGALANLGGTMDLRRGTVSGNHALTGTGLGSDYPLPITGYTEGTAPAIPTSDQWAADAGSGGGLYHGGGTVTVGSGMSITGNTAQNGGGAAVGTGLDLTRSVTGYTRVAGGLESILTKDTLIDAMVPTYGGGAAAMDAASLTVKGGASLSDNTASGMGGGVFVTDGGNTATLEGGVILQRNTARSGGGLAAYNGAAATFLSAITDNTAQSGGGVYVGDDSTVTATSSLNEQNILTAQGSLSANAADYYGGGAYVDTSGHLILDGALVNNNSVGNPRSMGVGVYNSGTLTLTADSGTQPTVSYNDRIYLALDKVVTLGASYDITQSGQNVNNRLTLNSFKTQNGTQIIQAHSAEQAADTLQSGFITHYTHPMTLCQTDAAILEINSVPVYYYDRFSAAEGLASHRVEVPYAHGDTVILQNFSVGVDGVDEADQFQLPSGMSFLRWVTINEQGEYLNSEGQVVDSPDDAHTYFAGNTIMGIRSPVYLEAVYGTVNYSALLQVLDEDGNVVKDHDDHMGKISLDGAIYNSATGEYTFAAASSITINPQAATAQGAQTVLQGLTVYEKMSQQLTGKDLLINGSYWTPVAEAVMDEETLDIPGIGEKTVKATGKMTDVTLIRGGTEAMLDGQGRFLYTASNKDILIRAQFKPAMVRLDVTPENAPISYTGYYDTMHEAVTATAGRVSADRMTDTYTLTLLAPNVPKSEDGDADSTDDNVVLYFGETGKEPEKCQDNDIVKEIPNGQKLRVVYDLNNYTLDYQSFGERNLKKYDMTVKNGKVVYHGDTDGTNPDDDPLPAAFRVAEGTLTLENVTILTTGTPKGGHNDKVYSAKVMEGGTLNIGRGCTLGDVFIYTDRKEIQDATPEKPTESSGHVTVTNTFVEGRVDPVATLCLRYWTFENQVRRVLSLSDDVATRDGVSIRRMFNLKDVDDDGKDHALYWFIGTDGKLYKKAAAVVPEIHAEGKEIQEPLTKYWDYTDKQYNGVPKHEIGEKDQEHAVKNGTPAWINGYPFYRSYYSTYGFSIDTSVSLRAQLMDGEGNALHIDRGTVAFTVSHITVDQTKGNYTDRRNFSGTTGLDDNGTASLSFPLLSEMPVSETLDLEGWNRPNNYYVLNATWAGAGQYAPQYADYWNYIKSTATPEELKELVGVTGSTLAGAARLSVQGKALTDPSVQIAAVTPRSAEYIGPMGQKDGYTSGPSVGRVVDTSLNRAMVPGTDYNIYYAALTEARDDPSIQLVKGADGQPLVCDYVDPETHEEKTLYYISGKNNTKIYYTNGGQGTKDGMTPANAKDINGAPAGYYSVALEAETPEDTNYVGQSGFKNTLFTIKPYGGTLTISGPNHIVVADGQSYADKITQAFATGRSVVTVSDRYGNELPLRDCAFTFAPISGSAKLDENGWPTAEGLYNLVVTATGHDNGTMRLPDTDPLMGTESNPNYAPSAAGYLAILITHKALDVFFVPQTVIAPYTGQIYTSDMVKALDRDDYLAAGGYQVWKTTVDTLGRPLDNEGNVIEVNDIPTQGSDDSDRLRIDEYRVEIGSPQHTPRDAGDYTMVVTDISGSYIGIGTLSITSESLGNISLSETEGIYTGVNHTPKVTVTDRQGKELSLNRDYVLRLTDKKDGRVVASPINAGTYTYTAVGINNYVSSQELSIDYTVKPKNLDNSDQSLLTGIRGVILDAPTYAITDGLQLVITYSLYYNGMTLTRGEFEDYDQVIRKNGAVVDATKDSGTYVYTISGRGNYTGTTGFTLEVQERDSALHITNTQEYTYNGSTFDTYNWQGGATINYVPEVGATTLSLDPARFNVTVLTPGQSGTFDTIIAPEQVLDAGIYMLVLTPQADYAQELDLPDGLHGNCILQIRRLPVTITLEPGTKVYGEHDPEFAQQGYRTNLLNASENGFYAHDSVTGQFGRNTGEDVRNSGYRYTLGNFSAGDNYILTVSVGTVFRIEPKDISVPAAGEDSIQVTRRETMSYTGYGLEPVQSVTYLSPRGNFDVADRSGYLPTYERWYPAQDGCVPGCTLEDCPHDAPGFGWQSISATPTDVAWYRVTLDADNCVTTPDNYVGTRQYIFEIQAQGGDLELSVEGGEDTVTYCRDDYAPVVTVKREGFVLAREYYTLTYRFSGTDYAYPFTPGQTKFREAGTYTIFARGSGNYVGSAGSVEFTILPKDLAEDDTAGDTPPVEMGIAPGQQFIYNGKVQQAQITADYLNEALESGDYTLSYQKHVDAGTASVTVTGQGNFTGSRVLTYSIEPQPLLVEVSNAMKVYGSADPAYSYKVTQKGAVVPGIRLTGTVGREEGEAVGDQLRLTIGTLSAGSNYTLSLSGEPRLTITAKSIGDGTAPAENISAQAPAYMAAEGVTAEDLKALPAVTYWAPALGKQTLVPGTDYTVAVTDKDGNSLAVGEALKDGETYTLTVTALPESNYTGSFRLTVTTVDADSLISLGKGETRTYRLAPQEVTLTPEVKDTTLKGCSIMVTANYNNGDSTLMYPKQDETGGQFSFFLTNAGTYTVVVTKSDEDAGGKVYFGTVTYVVLPKDITEGNTLGGGEASLNTPVGDTPEGDFPYTGEEVYPKNADELLVYEGETIRRQQNGATNYIVGYSGNVNPGTATVTVYGQGNYTGARDTTFKVGEIRYHLSYHENGALGGTVPTDSGLYMKDALATVQGNVGGLTGPTGTVFLGWSDVQLPIIQSDDKRPDALYVSGSLYQVGEDHVILYALWATDANKNGIADCDEDKYEVTYTYAAADECGGHAPIDPNRYLSGATVRVWENLGALSLNGYLLLGWAPMEETPDTLKLENSDDFFNFVSANDLYTEGRTFSMGSQNLTLYAVWGVDANKNNTVDWMESKVQYFVSYDGNGGAGTLPASHALEPETLTVTVAPGHAPAMLSRPGYVMLGWTADHDKTAPLTKAPAWPYFSYDSDKKLYTLDGKNIYVIGAGDPNPVVFYALWAVDENDNGIPDYEEPRYTLTFTNACDEVAAEMPASVGGLLTGTTVLLPDELEGTAADDRQAAFLGWTADEDAGKVLYIRGTAPEDLLPPGGSRTVTDSLTLYPVWGEPDYHTAQYLITVTPTPAEGGTAKIEGDKTTVLAGDDVTVKITVKPGYALSQVLINGVDEPLPTSDKTGRNFTLELSDIRENKSVVVAFARSQFRVVWPSHTTFDGTRQAPELIVYKSDDADHEVSEADYTLSGAFEDVEGTYADLFTHAGTYTVTVTGKEGTQYAGSRVQVPYIISPAKLTEVTIKDVDRPYKGAAYDDEIQAVKAGDLTVPKPGYTALYSGNLNVGTASVVVTGQGDYTGSLTATFPIDPAEAGSLVASWSAAPSLTYNGQPHRPTPTVKVKDHDDLTLTENVDYTLSYPEDVINAGEKPLQVIGKGNFAGTEVTLSYTVKQKSLAENDRADNTGAVTILPLADQTYTGSELKPVPIPRYGASPVLTLAQGTDFTLTYSDNTAVGEEATVTLTGCGNYTGTRTLKFKIVPRGSGLTAAPSVERTYNGQGQLLSREELDVKVGDTPLTPGTDYTVAYTAMTDTGAALENGAPRNAGTYVATITAQGSYIGVAQTTLTIAPAELTALTVDETAFSYDGEPHAPAVQAVKAGSLTLTDSDYTVAYLDKAGAAVKTPTQAGEYTLAVTGHGNFTGTLKETFLIAKGTALTVSPVADRLYDGLPYRPQPQVKAGERPLTENVDYLLAFVTEEGEPASDLVNAGEKKGKVTGLDNYEGAEGLFTYTILPKTLEDTEAIQVAVPDQVYTGTALTPAVTVTYRTADGRILFLTKDRDYTLSYENNTDVGEASVTVTGQGNYTGTRTPTFQITSAGGKNLSVTVDPASRVYNGQPQEPTVTARDGETVLVAGRDYTVSYAAVTGELSEGKPLTAGSYDVVIKGQGNYEGDTGTASFVLAPAPLGEVTVDSAPRTYNGEEKEPAVTVKSGETTLTRGTDYTLSYSNNVNAGTATVTVTGQGNYKGSAVETFSIAPAALLITPTQTEKTFGETDSLGYAPVSRADYAFEGALTREAGENVDEYAFDLSTLRETSGNYTLALADPEVKFAILPKSLSDGEALTQTGDLTVGYTGDPFAQSIPTLYAAQLGSLLLSSADYTVTYDGAETPPTTPGTYEVVVEGQGNYSGSYAFQLTISDGILGVTMDDDTVTYNSSDYADGMLERLSAAFNGTEVDLTGATLTFQNAAGEPVTELVDVGSYTVLIDADGYDPVTHPFLILPRDINEAIGEIEGDAVYDGEAKEPTVTLTDGEARLAENTDYTLSYKNNTQAGTASVTVTGRGNYTGTKALTFLIAQKALAEADVGTLDDVTFTGAAQRLAPAVTGLTQGRDYTLAYAGDTVNVGTVTVTVTGQGNYSGTVTRTYGITPKALRDDYVTVVPGHVTYTGTAQQPLVLVADGATRLIADTDYTVAYKDNTEVGTATVTVTAKAGGNYQGTASGEFAITANAVLLTVGLDKTEALYTGGNVAPTLSVTSGGTAVTDFAATYTCNGTDMGAFDGDSQFIQVGVYVITVTGTGSYAGTSGTVVFSILPTSFQVAPVADQDYTGGPVTPLPAVTRTGDNAPLLQGTDYLLTYANNVALGEKTASVTVTGLGNYAGTVITVPFTITGANTLFHLTYNSNGSSAGEAPIDGQSYLSGAQATLQSHGNLGKLGALFLGWSTQKTDLITSRTAQEAAGILQPGTTLTVTGNLTLYAVWAADSDHNGRPDYAEQVVLTASAGVGGSISPSGRQTVAWGTPRVEFTVTVQSGFTFSGLTVDGDPVAVSTDELPTPLTREEDRYIYVFTDVKEDHVILATFRQNGEGGGGGGGGGTVTVYVPVRDPDDGPTPPDESGVDRFLEVGHHTAYLLGREDGLFYPNAQMTRAEAAMMLYRLLKDQNVTVTVSFEDVPEDAWYATAVNTLASLGILKGVGEGRFEPDRPITRSEFAALVARMSIPLDVGEVRAYTDITPADWFYADVQLASYYGWLAGYPDGSFGPLRNITRGEAAKVLNAMTGRRPDRAAIDRGLGTRFPDVVEKHWAFYEIIEAATTHDHRTEGGVESWGS